MCLRTSLWKILSSLALVTKYLLHWVKDWPTKSDYVTIVLLLWLRQRAGVKLFGWFFFALWSCHDSLVSFLKYYQTYLNNAHPSTRPYKKNSETRSGWTSSFELNKKNCSPPKESFPKGHFVSDLSESRRDESKGTLHQNLLLLFVKNIDDNFRVLMLPWSDQHH